MRIQQSLISAEAETAVTMERETTAMGDQRQMEAPQNQTSYERKSKLPSTLALLSMRLSREDRPRAGGTSQSGMSLACRRYGGQAIAITQKEYIRTCKAHLPQMAQKLRDMEEGGCLGFSMLWLSGRHAGMDDKAVISQMLGYDPDTDKVTSVDRAKSGIAIIHQTQETFQNNARGELDDDPRFDAASPVVRRYNLMCRIAEMTGMPAVPVKGEAPFVLLQREGGLGDQLSQWLHLGHEQQLWVQSDEHAMAVYSNGHDQFAFYDPDNGMFSFASHDKFIGFMNEAGNMIHPSYSRKMALGGPDVLLFMQIAIGDNRVDS